MIPFAAVLLAGGQSQRMGRDKVLLPLADGRLLWQRQLAVLRALGPAELFISGPAREGFPTDLTLLADEMPGLGPLAGIAAALAVMRSARLLVLAVDLPMMTDDYLRGLLEVEHAASPPQGIIPQASDGFFEPLAAVYPAAARAFADAMLSGHDRSLQTFIRLLIENRQASARPITDAHASLFANWNQPENVAHDT